MLPHDARVVAFLCLGLLALGFTSRAERAAAQQQKDIPAVDPHKEGGKAVKGLVALAEVVDKPAQGLIEVRLSVKNVSGKPLTICQCPYLESEVQVQWLGPDGKKQASRHYGYPPSNFLLSKDYFVSIAPGATRHIVPTLRFHTAHGKPAPLSRAEASKLDLWQALDELNRDERSALAVPGEHRVTVSFTNDIVSYPVGRGAQGGPSEEQVRVDHVWTGTVTARPVTFRVK